MASDDGSAGPLLQKSDGADSARPQNGMHPRRGFDLLASEAREGGRSNAGDTGREAGHGVMEDQEGTEAEEEGDKTLQRTLPV